MKAGTASQEVAYNAFNLGASYNLGFVKPMLLIATERGAGRSVKAYTLGASAPVGQSGEFRIGYTRFDVRDQVDANSSKLGLGYIHTLSKRTAIYGLLARVSNDSNANRGFAVSSSTLVSPLIAPGDNATGYSIGVRHSF